MGSPRLLLTSPLCVTVPLELETQESPFTTKEATSIELYLDSWLRVVTSLPEMAVVENQSMEKNLPMRTLTSSIPALTSSQWPTPDPTPTDPNSSLLSLSLHGSMDVTPFSEKFSKECLSLTRWKVSVPAQESPRRPSQSLTLEDSERIKKTRVIVKSLYQQL